MLPTNYPANMRLKQQKDFRFILDAIELMPKKKRVRVNLKTIDRVLAFGIVVAWAIILFVWHGKE